MALNVRMAVLANPMIMMSLRVFVSMDSKGFFVKLKSNLSPVFMYKVMK